MWKLITDPSLSVRDRAPLLQLHVRVGLTLRLHRGRGLILLLQDTRGQRHWTGKWQAILTTQCDLITLFSPPTYPLQDTGYYTCSLGEHLLPGGPDVAGAAAAERGELSNITFFVYVRGMYTDTRQMQRRN